MYTWCVYVCVYLCLSVCVCMYMYVRVCLCEYICTCVLLRIQARALQVCTFSLATFQAPYSLLIVLVMGQLYMKTFFL